MITVPPNVLALYFKFRELIRRQKWTAAFAIADALDLAMKEK